MKRCFFIGHRETSRQILPDMIEAIEKLIREEQVTQFYVGGYGNFDLFAGEAVIQLKKKYRSIELFLVLPYQPAECKKEMPPGYDGTFYPDGMETVSGRYAIVKANQKMIDTCDWLIAYVTHTVSNAQKLLEYAMRREKKGLFMLLILEKMKGMQDNFAL